MEDIELQKMWKGLNENIDEVKILNLQSWAVNRRTFEYLQTHKAQSKLKSLSTLKKFGVAIGILWILFLGKLIEDNQFQNLYFTISIGMLMLFSILAIVVYVRQIIFIEKINFAENIIDTQSRLAELQTSSLNIIRILWLQMPFYSTFFWSADWIANDYKFWITAFPITLFLTFLSVWLFRNISLKNVQKKWFKVLLSTEWSSISNAKNYLDEIEIFKKEK